ncbi:MAG: peptidylprolyl isomerase [bacterium]
MKIPAPIRCALVLALFATGCSSDSPVLIQTTSQTVTVADYERAAAGSQSTYATSADARGELLDDLLRRAIMLELAHRNGFDTSAVVRNSEMQNERRLLVQGLVGRMAPQAQRVSEAEALALYEARKQDAHVLLLYRSDRKGAERAIERLEAKQRAGASWNQAFLEVNADAALSGLLPPDGDMGPVPPGSLPDPLDAALRTLPIGTVGGPYSGREGWFVMVVTERTPRESGTWEAQRAAMFDLARQRKQRAAFDRAYATLKQEYAFTPQLEGAQTVFRAIQPSEPWQPDSAVRQQVLATWFDGRATQVYTLGDALDDFEDTNTLRPRGNSTVAIEMWIEQQVMMRVFMAEARRRHLHEEPEVARDLRNRRDQFLLESMYQGIVAAAPPAGPREVEAVWQQVRDRFVQVRRARFAVADLPDSATTLRVLGQSRTSGSLVEAVAAVDPALTVREVTVVDPAADPEWAASVGTLQSLAVGGWAGPEPHGTGWRILQMIEKDVVAPSFADLPENLRSNLLGSATELAQESHFQAYTDSLVQAYQPLLNRELMKTLPVPGAPR